MTQLQIPDDIIRHAKTAIYFNDPESRAHIMAKWILSQAPKPVNPMEASITEIDALKAKKMIKHIRDDYPILCRALKENWGILQYGSCREELARLIAELEKLRTMPIIDIETIKAILDQYQGAGNGTIAQQIMYAIRENSTEGKEVIQMATKKKPAKKVAAKRPAKTKVSARAAKAKPAAKKSAKKAAPKKRK